MSDFPKTKHPDLLAGYENAEDAGVFRITKDKAVVQTLDFLTPVVDDPYIFGQVAAANSLSDVYAMGGYPITAMNIVCFPSEVYSADILKETLSGGRNKMDEAGAVLVGGHSVEDAEFKYGLSVTGLVHPDKILTNSGVKKGQDLILTKSIGTGIVSTAIKGNLAGDETVKEMIENMISLNKYAYDVFKGYNIGGCTDITGFGLAGHLMEMALGSKKKFIIDSSKIPIISGALEMAEMGLLPAGAYRNRIYCKDRVFVDSGIRKSLEDSIYDPQTSGGLIISADKDVSKDILNKIKDKGIVAEIIGDVAEDHADGGVEIF